jgi:hypothetical protein
MTAYEVTQDLLNATTAANPAAVRQPHRRTGFARFRAIVTGGVAAGALLLAAPVANAAAVPSGPAHSAVAAGTESTLPATVTLTPRRTGSVAL